MRKQTRDFWNTPLTRTLIHSDEIRLCEMLFGYLVGPFGAMLAFGIFTSILQNYFTDVLKLDLSFLSNLQLVSTLLIVASNLIVGQLIERTHVMAGKARPWILLSAFTLSVTSVLMFAMPFEGTQKMVWVAIAYNLYYAVAYPIYNTANSTLIAVSTRDSKKRGALASLSNIAGLGIMGVGSMIFPILVSTVLKELQGMWLLVMLAIAMFTALSCYLQFKFTKERVTEERLLNSEKEIRTGKARLRPQLRAVIRERSWWMILLFYLLFQWSGAMKNGSMAYFCKWVMDNSFFGEASAELWGASQSLLAILGAIPMAVVATFIVPLSNRFTKRWVVFVGLVIGSLGGVLAGIGNGNVIMCAIGVTIKCLGSAPACYLILAMLADVIDRVESTSGIRTDGLTMSIYSSIMVAATPVCNAIFSSLLRNMGYSQYAEVTLGTMAQPSVVQNAITFSYIWIETIAFVLCALLILSFTVEKRKGIVTPLKQ